MPEKQMKKEQAPKPETAPEKQKEQKETPPSPEKEKTLEKQQEQKEVKRDIRDTSSLPTSVFERVEGGEQREVKDKEKLLREIEEILSEDIKDHYEAMSEKEQKKFKEKGEETALKIKEMIKQAKIAVYKIVGLIKKWLLIIPGVNKYFLEQETKIKTDKILDLARKRKNKKVK